MEIKQFENKALSHYSYAVQSNCMKEIILIDPGRDIVPYLIYAVQHDAKITGVIETHPHADFVSGHLELHESLGATIYCSNLLGAEYPHETFDEGDIISLGKIKLKALNTPGHSPDSISIVLEHEGIDKAVFTGDTLFIGDCGRPDLRENAGNTTSAREKLAAQMYHSLQHKLMRLHDDVLVYPAHGAGSLCGKELSEASSSTIGEEKKTNWSLQPQTEDLFVRNLIAGQPFIPRYFSYAVWLNKRGAKSLNDVLPLLATKREPLLIDRDVVIIDSRPEYLFKQGHLPGAFNLQAGGKFESWLGSILSPDELFYLVANTEEALNELIMRTADIGYECFIAMAFTGQTGACLTPVFDLEHFKANPGDYTIVDIRNESETKAKPIFITSIHIPLNELRERIAEIPEDKPILVHCAGGYRSAAGSSIIQAMKSPRVLVFDFGVSISSFMM